MIQNATEVRLIIHLLKYLKNNADLESKAQFLNYLAQNSQDQMPVHDFIAKGMSFTNEKEFENWLESFHVNLSFQNIRKKSLYEAVEILITKFLNLKVGNSYIQYFLDIVLERDIRNQAGISDFLNYWDKNAEKFSIPSPEGTNAVRIMTIHKSKGLEFPVVIFPFAEEDYNRKPKDKLWLSNEEEAVELPKILIDNTSSVEGFGDAAKAVYDSKKQEELLDNINVLYVALTRAEEQLYVISQQLKPKKDGEYPSNMASFFIKYLQNQSVFDETKLEYEFGNAAKLSSAKAHIDTSKVIESVSEVLNPKNIKIAQREAIMWGTHQQEAIEYGNLIHEILSFVKTKEDVDFAITNALENGLITNNQKEMVAKTICEIVNHSELENYFDKNNLVLNEQTIIQKEGNLVKPDRMVISNKNEVYLLDYKTGSHQPKYKQQLENYQTAIEKMGYKVNKKALIYIGEKIEVLHL
jgi:ATP-dependent exoDNAse (exonuclease V) beta subunit